MNAKLQAGAAPTSGPHTLNQASNQASVVIAMRTIAQAEGKYAGTYGHGYTCSLSDLGGMGGTEASDHQAMLIDPRLASGKKFGYRFQLQGCDRNAEAGFVLTAVPEAGSAGQIFCTDQSAAIRAYANGPSASCMTQGKPLQ
jgi:hypothetical protein